MAISMEIDKVDNPTDTKSIAEDAKSNTVFFSLYNYKKCSFTCF